MFDLDNVISYPNIRSFVFIPIHGSDNKVIGVIQLYNKRYTEINENDVNYLKSLQKILGIILENVMYVNDALNFYINAKDTTTKLLSSISMEDNKTLVMMICDNRL